jgi:mycofactocin precursor
MTPPVTDTTAPSTPDTSAGTRTATTAAEPDVVAEDLIEEVSIDGMCGVY